MFHGIGISDCGIGLTYTRDRIQRQQALTNWGAQSRLAALHADVCQLDTARSQRRR